MCYQQNTTGYHRVYQTKLLHAVWVKIFNEEQQLVVLKIIRNALLATTSQNKIIKKQW